LKDPVCCVNVQNDEITYKIGEGRFYFCSKECLEKFKTSPKEFVKDYLFDLIIIGAGPAGLTAAVYASTLRINSLLISMDVGGRLVDTNKIRNYMGFDLISGPDLIKRFEDQIQQHKYINHNLDIVSKIRKEDNSFMISTVSGRDYRSSSLIIATGMKKNKLNVRGEKLFLRKGVTYSLSKNLQKFFKKNMAVVGGGNSGLQFAMELSKFNCKVILISIMPLSADPAIYEAFKKLSNVLVFDHHTIIEIKGKTNVEEIDVKDLRNNEETSHKVKGVLIAIGHSPNSSLVNDFVDLTERKEIIIDAECRTKTPGLFACGDVTCVRDKRIIIAAGEGAKAALAAKRFLKNSD
jgi:alkyl hydroperoxide reductase subunit F